MKRVLIIESGLFVGGVIKEVLKSRPSDLEVVSLVPVDVAEIRRVIEEYQPDVLIADDTSSDEVMNAILLDSICCPKMRLVIFCAGANNVNIYSTQRVEVAHLNDFLAVLTEGESDATAHPI
jgi:chemotaxis response regulator CheB